MVRSETGGAVIETALVLPLLLTILFGVCDFGIFFINSIAVSNAAGAGVRFATVNPSSWSNSPASAPPTTPPPPNSINSVEGVMYNSGGSTVRNDDSHILVTYWILPPTGSTLTQCGQYSTAANGGNGGFVVLSGHSIPPSSTADCVVPGNLINVKLTWTYTFLSPWFNCNICPWPNGLTINPVASMVETN